MIICHGALKVAVDGSHVLKYDHRVALQRVDTLSISGRVTVTAVGILPSLVSVSTGSGSGCVSCWIQLMMCFQQSSAEASPTNEQPHMKVTGHILSLIELESTDPRLIAFVLLSCSSQ